MSNLMVPRVDQDQRIHKMPLISTAISRAMLGVAFKWTHLQALQQDLHQPRRLALLVLLQPFGSNTAS